MKITERVPTDINSAGWLILIPSQSAGSDRLGGRAITCEFVVSPVWFDGYYM